MTPGRPAPDTAAVGDDSGGEGAQPEWLAGNVGGAWRIGGPGDEPIRLQDHVLDALAQYRDVRKMPTRLPEENGFSLTRFNKGHAPVGFEDGHGNPRKSRSRAYIENRNRFVRRRKMGAEKEGLAVVSNYDFRAWLHCGQVHPLVPTDQQFVVMVELGHLRLTQLRLTQLWAKELSEPVRRGHRG